MKHRKLTLAAGALALAVASFTANAAIIFQNLGTAAPPTSLGTHAVTPFNVAAQAAVTDGSFVSIIPGNPVSGNLMISPAADKRTVPYNWSSSWAHGYTGPVFFVSGSSSATLTLPPNTKAFYFYYEGNYYGTNTVTVTTNSGVTSGPLPVTTNPFGGAPGANGMAFYSTAGETITSITISAPTAGGFSVGEFGISGGFTTCAAQGFTGAKLTLCRKICEMPQSASTLSGLIKLYMAIYRQEPPCAN